GGRAPRPHGGLALGGAGGSSDGHAAARPAAQALKSARRKPVKLDPKAGLPLINGTDGMLGMPLLACADAERLFRTADVTAAMSAEALLGTDRTFQARLQEVRPHPGQAASAANLARLMSGSQIVTSHRHSQHAVQDSYSVRCSPQVAGAARDTLEFARRISAVELSSAMVAETRRLAAPASVDSVPTSGMQEDHVSMGWGAALKLRTVLDNVAHILAVELCAAARAQELRRPLEPSPATASVRDVLRKQVGGAGPDRVVAPEL